MWNIQLDFEDARTPPKGPYDRMGSVGHFAGFEGVSQEFNIRSLSLGDFQDLAEGCPEESGVGNPKPSTKTRHSVRASHFRSCQLAGKALRKVRNYCKLSSLVGQTPRRSDRRNS